MRPHTPRVWEMNLAPAGAQLLFVIEEDGRDPGEIFNSQNISRSIQESEMGYGKKYDLL